MQQAEERFVLKRPSRFSTVVWITGLATYIAMWITIHHGTHEPAWPFWPALLTCAILFVPSGLYAATRRRGKIARATPDGLVLGWFILNAFGARSRRKPWRLVGSAFRWDVLRSAETGDVKGSDGYTGLAIDVRRTAILVLRSDRRVPIASIASDVRPLYLLRHDDPWEGKQTKVDELVLWLNQMMLRFGHRTAEAS